MNIQSTHTPTNNLPIKIETRQGPFGQNRLTATINLHGEMRYDAEAPPALVKEFIGRKLDDHIYGNAQEAITKGFHEIFRMVPPHQWEAVQKIQADMIQSLRPRT